jgi:hypothetical protein
MPHDRGDLMACGGCKRGKAVRWLGMWWYGVPWPQRKPRPRFGKKFPWIMQPTEEHPGCGCLVVPKRALEATRRAWLTWRMVFEKRPGSKKYEQKMAEMRKKRLRHKVEQERLDRVKAVQAKGAYRARPKAEPTT